MQGSDICFVIASLALNWCEQCHVTVPYVVSGCLVFEIRGTLDQFAWIIAVMQPQVELNYVNVSWTFNIANCFFFFCIW